MSQVRLDTGTITSNMCLWRCVFDVTHALSCPTGRLPTIRHNEIRDTIAVSLSKVCSDVQTEPHFFTQEDTSRVQAVSEGGANDVEHDSRLDIRARGFWGGCMEMAFFDVWVFNPFDRSAITTSLSQLYQRQEAENAASMRTASLLRIAVSHH